MRTRTLKVDMLARVEGEGALTLRVRDDALEEVKLRIFEPPRFFEAFLCGRRYDEVPDITARICGICPIAYQISSATAMENALGVKVEGPLRDLRRLIYCGEWIESHALHIHLLHAPDFLGYEDGIRLAADHPWEVKRGLRLKKLGNEIMTVVGGREIHPVNIRVGGFFALPAVARLRELKPQLESALPEAVATARWVAGLDFPDFQPETEFVAMRHPDEYPLFDGRLVGSRGLDIAIPEFETTFEEIHEQHAHALHSRKRDGGCYQVGPIARFNLNRDRLTPEAASLAKELRMPAEVRNPFYSIVVRAIETVFAIEEAIRILGRYEAPDRAFLPVEPHASEGYGCSEAPRGFCWHKYAMDGEGTVTYARIVPPTSQNQARIEQDLREYVPSLLDLDDEQLKWRCEQAIRNYDPCISCATHFLDLEVDRG